MAAILVTTIKRFVGTAAERAALDITAVQVGSTFLETDTGLMYIISSAGAWVAKTEHIIVDGIASVKIDQTTPGTTNAVTLSGSSLAEQKTQADAVANVITFTGDINAIEIYHESATWQDFVVNGITLKIPSGGYRTLVGGVVAKTVTIPAGLTCIVGRLA